MSNMHGGTYNPTTNIPGPQQNIAEDQRSGVEVVGVVEVSNI